MKLGDLISITDNRKGLVLHTELGMVEDVDIFSGCAHLFSAEKIDKNRFLDILETSKMDAFTKDELEWAIDALKDMGKEIE